MEEKYLITSDKNYRENANKIFIFTLSITFLIYVYFFIRNFSAYKNASEDEKSNYRFKVIGSGFLIAGILCLLYFQSSRNNFVGTSAP